MNSSNQCNSFVEDFRRAAEVEGLAGPSIEPGRDGIELPLRNVGETRASREVLP